VPLAVALTSGNRNDVTQLLPLVDGIRPVAGKVGRVSGPTGSSPTGATTTTATGASYGAEASNRSSPAGEPSTARGSIRDVVTELPAQTFTYFDPPYYASGERLYENSYQDEEHAEVARLVRSVSHPWIVSYDAVPRVLRLYEGLNRVTYSLSYSAADRYRGSEVMVFSPDLDLPAVESPCQLVPIPDLGCKRLRIPVSDIPRTHFPRPRVDSARRCAVRGMC
jgi:hypothetical protein